MALDRSQSVASQDLPARFDRTRLCERVADLSTQGQVRDSIDDRRALLSGLTTPISNMPPSLQYFTFVSPLRYAIDIAQRVYLEGAGAGVLMPDRWPLAAASWTFRHRLR